MTIDKMRIRFHGKLISAANNLNASVEGEGVDPFIDLLYDQWQKAGLNWSQVENWLHERISESFLSMNTPPKWVEDEPSWPFENGTPMVFINQTTLEENEICNAHLSAGETVYLFGARRPRGNGFEMTYKVVSQFSELASSR